MGLLLNTGRGGLVRQFRILSFVLKHCPKVKWAKKTLCKICVQDLVVRMAEHSYMWTLPQKKKVNIRQLERVDRWCFWRKVGPQKILCGVRQSYTFFSPITKVP